MPNEDQKTSQTTKKTDAKTANQQTESTKTAVDDSNKLQDNGQSQSVVHPIDLEENESKSSKTETKKMSKSKKSSPIKFVLAGSIAILLGIATGYGSYKLYASSMGVPVGEPIEQVASGEIQAGDVFGSADTDAFKDSAKGYIEAGGLDGEGTHSLLRAGGPSQTVYLTSSVTDLDKLVGMEVEVWGETFKGQKAGWLMDVGRVQVDKVDGEKPAE